MTRSWILFLLLLLVAIPAAGQEIRLVRRAPDPYGSPRPFDASVEVPLRTSLYLELELFEAPPGDRILPNSVSVQLQAGEGKAIHLVRPYREMAEGARGWLRPRHGRAEGLAVYVDPGVVLQPSTAYTVRAAARSREGAELSVEKAAWTFTTGGAAEERSARLSLDLGEETIRWHGGFFTGICNVVFCTREETFGPLYRSMREAQETHPRAWRYQRDIWMTATDDRKPDWHLFMDPLVPNLVRERQTRRITAIEEHQDGLLLRLEDFFGHEQYGVAAGRPLSGDYEAGYEVLIADGVSDARSKVLAVDDGAGTMLIERIAAPEPPWHLEYQTPPPEAEKPDAPGLFAAGGTHLRRFDPPGTPVYFWGRLDKEWDLAHTQGGRRLVVNFVEAPTDLSLTGREYTRPKDYAVWHEVVHTITGHLIDRYGDASLDFAWSVFNEPDLVGDYWRFHWDEVQRFYDYTVDAILRAFEDRGYDSDRVRVGGWELGAIFGTNLRLREILAHCSPTAVAKGALEENAAFADRRLDGRRSRRVEQLCRAHDGKGSPCDFLSIHTYNRSEMAAAKLIRAKEMALATDPEFYRDLWINSHESCPNWSPPPDEGASDSYLGNGYFPSWCLDVAARLLRQASADPRYGYGENVITIWPPPTGPSGANVLGRHLPVDDDGDGLADGTVFIPSPIFHALSLLSDLGPDYWVLPERQIGSHTLGGFASRDPQGPLRVALFSHDSEDIQSRSDGALEVELDLFHAGNGPFRATEFRFDRESNTTFHELLALRDAAEGTPDFREVEAITRVLEEGEPDALREAFEKIRKLPSASLAEIAPAFLQMGSRSTDPELLAAAKEVAEGLVSLGPAGQQGHSRAKIDEILRRADLRPTAIAELRAGEDGNLRLTTRILANGASFFVIESGEPGSGTRKP